jgi:hypothetical protein
LNNFVDRSWGSAFAPPQALRYRPLPRAGSLDKDVFVSVEPL